MKTVTILVRQTELNRLFPDEFKLCMNDSACMLDVIQEIDRMIKTKTASFPVKGYNSLQSMVWHPIEQRFYTQVGVQAYTATEPFLNVRENPRKPLPNEVTIILVPQAGCTSDWEMMDQPKP